MLRIKRVFESLIDLGCSIYIFFERRGMAEDNKFDGILMTMIQQKGNIDGFFDGIFGFLRRNTDFFADQKKAE